MRNATPFSWPSNTWPAGSKEKAIGRLTLQNSLSGLSGVSMAVFTRAYGMSTEEVEAELVDVRGYV